MMSVMVLGMRYPKIGGVHEGRVGNYVPTWTQSEYLLFLRAFLDLPFSLESDIYCSTGQVLSLLQPALLEICCQTQLVQCMLCTI